MITVHDLELESDIQYSGCYGKIFLEKADMHHIVKNKWLK
jgi:hypothetical protein